MIIHNAHLTLGSMWRRTTKIILGEVCKRFYIPPPKWPGGDLGIKKVPSSNYSQTGISKLAKLKK